METEYLIVLSRDLGYLTPTSVAPLLEEIREIATMLHYLRVKVEPKPLGASRGTTKR